MNSKEINIICNNIYTSARNNDIKAAKTAYLTFLERAKESPSIAKLILKNSLEVNKDISK